jgi:hypothetical protein
MRHSDSHDSSEEIRGERKDETDDPAIAESFDNGGQEVLEADGRQVKVVHEAKNPHAPVAAGLLETNPDARSLTEVGSIDANSVVGVLFLLLIQPAGLERVIGQHEESEDGGDDRQGTLNDE